MTADRTEFLNLRRTGIGGSDVAAILGMSKYKTALDVYNSKRGNSESADSARMEMGRYYEAPLLDWYRDSQGFTDEGRGVFLRHPKYPFIIANLDMWGRNEHGDRKIVDAKNIHYRVLGDWGEDGSDEVPLDALFQAHHYLFVVPDAYCCDFVVNRAGAWPPRIHTVQRDDEVYSLVFPKLQAFWKCVEAGFPPEFDFSDDKTLSAIKELFPPKPEKAEPVALPEAVAIGEKPVRLAELAEAYELLGKIEKETGARRKRVEAALRAALGDSQSGTVDEIKIVRTFVKGSHVEAFDKAPYDYLRLTFPKTYERKVTAARVTALLAEGEHQ